MLKSSDSPFKIMLYLLKYPLNYLLYIKEKREKMSFYKENTSMRLLKSFIFKRQNEMTKKSYKKFFQISNYNTINLRQRGYLHGF